MNARAPLNIVALGNCWELVHPDVIHIPELFAGYSYWMAFTPYPLGNDRLENPVIRASRDGLDWRRVPGVPEPLVPPPDSPQMHHADPELLLCQRHLQLVYLTIRRKTAETTFNVIDCGEDLVWGEPKVFGSTVGAVSPTLQVEEGVLHEWYIRNFKLVRRDGPDLFNLGQEYRCRLDIPNHVPWHIDIQKVGDGYEALVAAFPWGTDNSRTRLFHLFSKDGLTFVLSRQTPIIRPSLLGWDNKMIYRSSFTKEQDGTYRIWYSGSSWGLHFGIGLLQGPIGSLKEPRAGHAPVPRLTNRIRYDFLERVRYEKARSRHPTLLTLVEKATRKLVA